MKYPGINIQQPISRLILDGKKTVETRTYNLPSHFLNKEMVLIETPGSNKNLTAQALGIIVFTKSFKYESKKEFYADQRRHCVDQNSIWAWKDERPKWGWEVKVISIFPTPLKFKGKKGIKYTLNLRLDLKNHTCVST